MKYLYANDIHLEMVSELRLELFVNEISQYNADAL